MEDLIRTFSMKMQSEKAKIPELNGRWYPYGSLSNFMHLDELIPGGWRSLQNQLIGSRLADIGVADGETSFFLEQFGIYVDVIENASTNFNGLQGFKALHRALNSRIRLFEVDLDQQFSLEGNYDFAMLLGILYHLKNPFYVLETLAKRTKRLVLSTRVCTHNAISATELRDIPVAYLLNADENNNDATNYWIFSEAGLQRIIARSGWRVLNWRNYGTDPSDPYSLEHDQRAFIYLESVSFGQT